MAGWQARAAGLLANGGDMSDLLARYEPPWTFAQQGISHPIYSAGSGRTVVILHELPGMIEQCLDLGLILAERFRVHLPLLLGEPGKWAMAMNVARLCVSREIHAFAANRTSPLVDWLRALCQKLKNDSGEAGIGVVGMCLTGGFALALVADEAVLAPVVAQPSLPLLVHKAALGISPEHQEAIRKRAARLGPGCVLALRYAEDRIAAQQKIDTIRALIGPALRYVEVEGKDQATLTVHRHATALRETIDFLSSRLS
jgi:dienelactone hydrolase